ncbi:MAG: tRNA pseudouridine(55) synthase TruB [Melioribacteraceae bacterium]|nr:tRNA pseudouridine(55) synthase TruB [Melioribacteraceae bacterium]
MITKETKVITQNDLSEGLVLLIDKEKSKTSFDIIREVRRILSIKKVGHSGTLDPMATGLLILCTGRKTKEIYKYQNMTKVYEGTIKLGATTPTMDAEGEIENEKSYASISKEQIDLTRKLFIGRIKQIPPMYSAIKHKGKSLYKYARKGIEIKREPREVNINRFVINDINLPDVKFTIECSKGTYIRVLANDFGKELGCGAYLSELRRTAIGEYSVSDALTTDELKTIETFSLEMV